MQPRRIARELALLALSQLPQKPERLTTQDLQSVVVAAVRTLAGEAQDALETAAMELKRGRDRLLASEIQAVDVQSSRAMVTEAITLAETAVNRLGMVLDLPEFVQLANQQQVRDFSLDILKQVLTHRTAIDHLLETALVDWQFNRLAQIDRNILRIAVAEILYLKTPTQVTINEAVELAKRYSDEDGYRFVNGVLRRTIPHLEAQAQGT
uniref:Transcription antitermination protein NusB n=1 Tax=Cyanothece sp. (strain PCC 7425 / ATCC 29141) TaxID=395961 RepID=NUSB_CYAP4|nr:RecName: Full=Transcription antitermination protein NusB; AltName: Full=Antitermination factor NusB [Cyanothece sp. PCC 7425]